MKSEKKKKKKVSAFAKKREVESALMAREQLLVLMYKDVYFTNDPNSSLPCEVVRETYRSSCGASLPNSYWY